MIHYIELEKIKQLRFDLRAALIKKMQTNPTMEDSETLRLVENDISFWDKQTNYTVSGLIETISQSLKRSC